MRPGFKLRTNKKLKRIKENAFSGRVIKKVTFKSDVIMEPGAFEDTVKIYTTKGFRKARTVLSYQTIIDGRVFVMFSKVAKAKGYQIRVKMGKKTYNYQTTKNKFEVVSKFLKSKKTPTYIVVRPYKLSKNKKKIYGKWSGKMILTK